MKVISVVAFCIVSVAAAETPVVRGAETVRAAEPARVKNHQKYLV